MKNFILALSISGSVFVASGLARAQPVCDMAPESPYRMDVKVEVPPVQVNRNLGRDQLTAMGPHGPNSQVLGLMNRELELSMEREYGYVAVEDQYCYWVNSVMLTLRYRTLEVYVASEYSPRSCAYQAILAHEQRHVKIAKKYVTRYAPRLRSVLTSLRIPKPGSAKLAPSMDRARADMDTVFTELLAPVFEELNAEHQKAQARADLPQEYARVRRRCKKW